MSNLIPLDQAAKMLRLSPERLVEMISKKQIFGYRDGSSWKFKKQEIERVADDLAINLASGESGILEGEQDSSFSLSDSSLNDDLILDDSDESEFQLSDGDLGGNRELLDDSEDDVLLDLDDEDELDLTSASKNKLKPGSETSKLLGKNPTGESTGKLFGDEDEAFDLSNSSLSLGEDSDSAELLLDGDDRPPAKKPSDSKSALDEDEDLLFGDSSLDLAADSGKNLGGKDNVHDEDLVLSDDPSGSTGKLLKAMGERVGDSKDELSLDDDDLFDDDLKLVDSDSLDDAVDLSSDFEDSDIVLDDSDSSSDLILESNDEGISLSANDSGISLSDSLELGGSDIDELELPDDDMVSLAEAADADAATMMQEDDFNLTPFESGESDDASGSQVIALEDSDLFATDSESTLLGDADLQAQPQMVPDMGMAPTAAAAPAAGAYQATIPYDLTSVILMMTACIPLVLGAIVAYDAARNLWLPGGQVSHSGLLQFFMSMGGLNG